MRACLHCGTPVASKARCHCRAGARAVYSDPAYRAFRRWVLMARPVCALCGGPGADSVDHRVPVSEGGGNGPENLQAAHLACNVGKGAG